MRFPFNLRYLHEKPLKKNPLWYPGNPTQKLFLPLYWLRMVEPRKALPENFVKFECHWQMTSPDVKQYLEKLYNVSVIDVRIEIEKGKYIKHPKNPNALSPPMPDQKYAYVQLKDATFKFPKIFKEIKETKYDEELKTIEKIQNKSKNNSLSRLDIGSWFS
jgi:large subunit ribosomal protein L23